MTQIENDKFKIIFQKLNEVQSSGDDIINASQEVSDELEANSGILEELRMLAESKEEADHREFYTGT